MKTAEEILNEVIDQSGFDYDSAQKAMKAYASQFIDEAAKEATTQCDVVDGKPYNYRVDKSSILNLKSQLK